MTMIWEFINEKQLSEKGFILDVQESAQLPEGIIAVSNVIGMKLYFRLGEKTKEGTILHPLNKAELKSLQIEESANDYLQKLFDYEVEE
jgi:hypothetical protein